MCMNSNEILISISRIVIAQSIERMLETDLTKRPELIQHIPSCMLERAYDKKSWLKVSREEPCRQNWHNKWILDWKQLAEDSQTAPLHTRPAFQSFQSLNYVYSQQNSLHMWACWLGGWSCSVQTPTIFRRGLSAWPLCRHVRTPISLSQSPDEV